MPSGLVDWIVRTLMLVLAGLVTLSMLGAISAISNESGGPDAIFSRTERAAPDQPRTDPAATRPRAEAAPPSGEAGTSEVASVVPPPEDGAEQWLEAIAWALLTLVFLAALGLVLLFDAARQLRRLAAAAEARGTITAAQHFSFNTGE